MSDTPTSLEKKKRKHPYTIQLLDGTELEYYTPTTMPGYVAESSLNLLDCLPAHWPKDSKSSLIEVEIGPGKGEFLARRAQEKTDRYLVGIDRRQERTRLTENKLKLIPNEGPAAEPNWLIIREDARRFLRAGLPKISMLHVYQPDPWPKKRHHKNRFFRSHEAKLWGDAIESGGQLRFSTDHEDYFWEIYEIVRSWKSFVPTIVLQKTLKLGEPSSYFEGLFLKRGQAVWKAHFSKI